MNAVATGSLERLYYVLKDMPEYVSTARLAALKRQQQAITDYYGGVFLIAAGYLQFYAGPLKPQEALRLMHLCLIAVFGRHDLHYTHLSGNNGVQTVDDTLHGNFTPQATPIPGKPKRRRKPTLEQFFNRVPLRPPRTLPRSDRPLLGITPLLMPRIHPATG